MVQKGFHIKDTSPKLGRSQTVHKSHETGNFSQKRRLFTVKDAAAYLGRSEWGMRELAWAGKLPVVKPEGSRKIFFDILDLMEFIEKNKSTYL